MKVLLKIIIVIGVIIAIYVCTIFYVKKIIYVKKYESVINEIANKYDVDENLIYAIIKVESNFDTHAKSKAGAKGLMQIMDSTSMEISKKIGLNDFNVNMLYDPEINIELGTAYFKMLYDKYNSMELALIAYNAGLGNVDNWLDNNKISISGPYYNLPFSETTVYWQKVLREYKIFNYLYD